MEISKEIAEEKFSGLNKDLNFKGLRVSSNIIRNNNKTTQHLDTFLQNPRPRLPVDLRISQSNSRELNSDRQLIFHL